MACVPPPPLSPSCSSRADLERVLCSLDDLDDVLDSLTRAAASTSTAVNATPPSNTPPPPPPQTSTSFPDPDDDALPDPDDVGLDPDMARQLEQGMHALLANLGGGAPGGGGGSAPPDLPGGLPGLDEQEFTKMMQEMLKGDFGGGGGAPTGAGGGDDELQKLMAALGISEDDLAGLTGASDSNGLSGPIPAATASKARSVDPPTAVRPPPAAPANFQDAIAASMSKLRDSSTTADASRAASSSSFSAAQAGGGDSAGMAAMLAQLAGMPGGAGGLEGLDSDEGLQGMLDDMMKQLMSREMLYEPLKELADKVRRASRGLCFRNARTLKLSWTSFGTDETLWRSSACSTRPT